MSVYNKFLTEWHETVAALGIHVVADTCVFSHVLVAHPCYTATCWSQMLFYLRSAPSWIRVIPKDIVDTLHRYLLGEPPIQKLVRMIQTGIWYKTSCPRVNWEHRQCSHALQATGCPVCYPNGHFTVLMTDLIATLPFLRPTPDLVQRLISSCRDLADWLLVDRLTTFIAKHSIAYAALQLSAKVRHLMRENLQQRVETDADPHLRLLLAIV